MLLQFSPTASQLGEGAASGKPLTRGALAARTGCNIETIRYYERVSLLPPPPRSAGGHRLYGEGLIRRLNFVRRSRDLGFSIEEIRSCSVSSTAAPIRAERSSSWRAIMCAKSAARLPI